MNKIAVVDFQPKQVSIGGDLDFSNVMSVYQQVLARFSDYPQLVIDFSHLKLGNSAVIALMIECLKEAKSCGKTIRFCHLPETFQSIIHASGLHHLLESTV